MKQNHFFLKCGNILEEINITEAFVCFLRVESITSSRLSIRLTVLFFFPPPKYQESGESPESKGLLSKEERMREEDNALKSVSFSHFCFSSRENTSERKRKLKKKTTLKLHP